MEAVAAALSKHGLPTKPKVAMTETNVMGLKLRLGDGKVVLQRREEELGVKQPLTKRDVYNWCGKLTSHYPVCRWLRPAASWPKRLATATALPWDSVLPDELQVACRDLMARVASNDPVSGTWNPPAITGQWCVWCDASNIAYGVVLEVDGAVMEDQSWRRPADDK